MLGRKGRFRLETSVTALVTRPTPDTTWRCPRCNRAFARKGQQHSCRIVSVEEHFRRKDASRDLFNHLLNEISTQVGSCEAVPLPCCIHLFGGFDFLAVLPKKERLEIRFALHRQLASPRVSRSIQISKTTYKHCVDIHAIEAIDDELLGWLREAYGGPGPHKVRKDRR